MLTNDMLSILCCPTCRIGELRAEIEKQDGNQVQEGNLICDSCNLSYPALRHRMVTAGREKVEREFNLHISAAKRAELYVNGGIIQEGVAINLVPNT